MKQLVLVIFLLFPFLSFAQDKYTLTGILKVATGEAFSYKLVFTEAEGIIKGHSYTYKEPDDTKAVITGKLDRRTRILSFKETEILYSHEVHISAFMCLIDARIEYIQDAGTKVLKGPITSMEKDKTSCTDGVAVFDNKDELKALFEGRDKFDTVITMGKRPKQAPAVEEVQKPKEGQPLVTDKITTGIEKTYEWHNDTVIIDIWDGGKTDGDQVTLEYNGKQYLFRYSLVKQKKQLRIPISRKGIDVITILADNEGGDPPNTASLLFTDGAIQHSVLSYNNKGQVSMVRIKRVN